MGAAVALAVMLVVVVAILSLAVNAQGPFQASGPPLRAPRQGRPERSAHPGGTAQGSQGPSAAPPAERRRGSRARGEVPGRRQGERGPERHAGEPEPVPHEEAQFADADQLLGELKPLSGQANAVVMSVVDERTLGPVTRSRLTLRVEPSGQDPFEVMTRVAFPTPEERARVKVGGTIPVRYDPDDHRRVVVERGGEG
jgi:hypothetical protein